MTDKENGSYAIHVLGETRPSKGVLERLIFPHGRCHSFFMLEENGQPAAELHYTIKNSQGKTDKSLNPLNVLDAAAECGGMGPLFNEAVRDLGINKNMRHLEAVQVSAKHHLGDEGLIEFGKVEGTPEHILSLWNRACSIALEVNKTNIPFTQNAEWTLGSGPANCHAGTKTTLKRLGREFKAALENLSHRLGRELGPEVPGLSSLRKPKDETSLPTLEARRAELSNKLYQTSGYSEHRLAI